MSKYSIQLVRVLNSLVTYKVKKYTASKNDEQHDSVESGLRVYAFCHGS